MRDGFRAIGIATLEEVTGRLVLLELGHAEGGGDCVRVGEEELRPERLITGQDLIEAGYTPGPGFGPALERVETAQLEGEISTREEALALARLVLDKVT